MSNILSVLGFGQCGSKIAVEVSASFNPAKILSGDSVFEAAFRFVKQSIGVESASVDDASPAFYIADLNLQNDIYIHFAKAQAIYEIVSRRPDADASEVIELANRRSPHPLDESDISLVEDVKRKGEAFRLVQALHFEIRNRPMLGLGGAGGLQYLSEAIADQDDNLLSNIDDRSGGALVGIFSLGGGTGSGSLYSILTRYRKKVHRYTVGVGVIPDRQNIAQFYNAGRYFCKFIGTEPQDRYHTLFLFSNEAAMDLMNTTDLSEFTDPIDLVNIYISMFIFDFSQINDTNTITKFGKHFDPMDGKRFLNGVCAVGYSATSNFNVKSLFCSAISPLSFGPEGLRGVSTRLLPADANSAKLVEIGSLIDTIVNGIETSYPEVQQYIDELREITPFYRTIKTVTLFIFLRNQNDTAEASAMQKIIKEFFRSVSGSRVSVSINCYYTPEAREGRSSVLALFNGAFSFEVFESMIEYLMHGFVDEHERRDELLGDIYSLLTEVKELPKSVASGVIDTKLAEIMDRGYLRSTENPLGTEELDIISHPEIRRVLTAEKLEDILVNRGKVRKSLIELSSNFSLGTEEPSKTVAPW